MEYQNQDQGRALDWDEEVSDEGGFVLLDPGVYPFVVGGIAKERYEGGAKIGPCPRARVTLGIMTEGGMVDVRDSMLLHTKTAWRVARFFEALGFVKNPETGKVPMAWNQAEGRQGYVRLGVREFDKKDGGKRKSNEVEEYIPPKDWPQQQARPQAPAAPQAPAQPAYQQPAYQQQPLMQVPPAQPQAQHPSAGWSM